MKFCEYRGKACDTDAETCPVAEYEEDRKVTDDALEVTKMLLLWPALRGGGNRYEKRRKMPEVRRDPQHPHL